MDTEKATTEKPPETPTQDEAVNLKVELEKAKTDLANATKTAEEKEKGFKTLQRELSERDKRLSSFDAIQSEIQATREEQKILAAYVASLAGKSEEDYGEAKTHKEDLLKTFEEKEKQRKESKRVQELQVKADDIRQRVEALGFTSNDDEYWDFYDVVQTGNFPRAEAKLKKLEAKQEEKKKMVVESKETEDQKVERLVGEKYKKMLEDKGLLVSETGTPSGGSMNEIEAAVRFSKGEISREEYEKHR